MPYYLSYIEVNGHTSMMLSHQSTPTEPAKVVYQVGFGYLSEQDAMLHKFKTFKGGIDEEDNVAKALYSSSNVRHKTYEISNSEMEKFFTIINRDKRLNVSEYVNDAFLDISYKVFTQVRDLITDKKLLKRLKSVTEDDYKNVALTSEEMKQLEADLSEHPELLSPIQYALSEQFLASGPNYQLLRNNCKTYTLGVFKELGIVESRALSNYIVQQPGTMKEQLRKVSSNNMTCPIKDNALQKISNTLNQMVSALDKVEASLSLPAEHFSKAKRLIDAIQVKKNKIGVNAAVTIRIQNDLRALYAEIKNAYAIIEDEDIRSSLKGFRSRCINVDEVMSELTDYLDQNPLEFFWKGTPELSARIHLEHFNSVEKATYTAKIKTNEFLDGCSQMHQELNDLLIIDGSPKDYNLEHDVKYLQNLIIKYQDELIKTKDSFEKNSSAPMKDEQLIALCHKQNRNLQLIMVRMENDVKLFKPSSPKTFAIMRYINKLISYFKKDYHPVENPTNLARDKLKAIKHSVDKAQFKLSEAQEEKPDLAPTPQIKL